MTEFRKQSKRNFNTNDMTNGLGTDLVGQGKKYMGWWDLVSGNYPFALIWG